MADIQEAEGQPLAASRLGAPGPAQPKACATIAIDAMADIAGADFHMTSLALDVASQPLSGGEVTVRVSADKRSRSIVFASVEARQGDQLVFSAQGLFSRRRDGE